MKDIFGFREKHQKEPASNDFLERPIRAFNMELMMDFLGNKKIELLTSENSFSNEIQLGVHPGSVKLQVDTGYTFYIKKMVPDLLGNNRWITKRIFQLNRQGYGGHEDAVAGEIHEHLERTFKEPLDGPKNDFEDLENLVHHIARKVRRVAKHILVYERVKKLDEANYLIVFNVLGQGTEAPDQRRVEENLTQITYDRDAGTIRVMNYNIESPTGKAHAWNVMPLDFDVYFMPTQSFEEIAECVAVQYKYY